MPQSALAMSVCASSVVYVAQTYKSFQPILCDQYQSSQHGKIAWPITETSSRKLVNNIKGISPLLCSSIPLIISTVTSFFGTPSSNQQYPPFVDPKNVLQGNFFPVNETPPTECSVVEGELPRSLNGVYIRNGPNPQHYPRGPYHLFEGDGMLHSIKLCDGRAIFCNRYVKTNKYKVEHEAGGPMMANVIAGFYDLFDLFRFIAYIGNIVRGKLNIGRGYGPANTSIASFYGRIFAMMETDLPYEIEITKNGDITTKGRFDFNGNAPFNITAHPKINNESGEVFAYQCFPIFPYLTFFCFDADGLKQKHVTMSSIKHPIYVHDFAITKKHVVFQDIQIELDAVNLFLCKGMPVKVRSTKIPRVGVFSRNATTDSELRWFTVPGFNALHIVNAWEDEDDTITIIGPNLLPPEKVFENLDECRFSLEKLRVNLKTGELSRTLLSKKSLELGSINPAYQGKKNRYVYMSITAGAKMSGVVKIDLELGCEVATRSYGPDCFGGEPCFVARRGINCSDEDDGYIFSYVHDEKNNESNFVVMDAKSPNLDIVTAIRLPTRVPYGFHGLFVRS